MVIKVMRVNTSSGLLVNMKMKMRKNEIRSVRIRKHQQSNCDWSYFVKTEVKMKSAFFMTRSFV